MARVPDLMRSWRVFRSWPRPARWASYTAVVVVLLLVAGWSPAWSWSAVLPQTDGEIEVAGLDGEVRVVRDDNGIPQLYADTTDDLMRGPGLRARAGALLRDGRAPPRHRRPARRSCSARTRWRPTSSSARWAGAGSPSRSCALLEPETRAALEAYADGRQRLPRRPQLVGQIAVEYTVLGARRPRLPPRAVDPVDSLAWLKAMAWDLRGNMDEEIDRALALGRPHARAGRRALSRRTPTTSTRRSSARARSSTGSSSRTRRRAAPATPQRPAYTAGQRDALAAPARDGLDRLPALLGRGDGIGSNSWVVDGEHSATGEPLLANDPHLGVSAARASGCRWGCTAATVTDDLPARRRRASRFSGVPGVVIGHNADIAWGFTNLGPDVTDLYLERVDGDALALRRPAAAAAHPHRDDQGAPASDDVDAHRPLDRARAAALRRLRRAAPTVGAKRRPTPPGRPRASGYAVALAVDRAAARRRPPTRSSTLDTAHRLGLASARRPPTFAVPAQNLVYADREGHIGYQAPGPDPDPQVRQRRAAARRRAGAARTTGPATTCRSTGCRTCSTPTRASSSPPTRR